MKNLVLAFGLFLTPIAISAGEVPTVPDEELSEYCKMMTGVGASVQQDRNASPQLTQVDFLTWLTEVESVIPKIYVATMIKHVFYTYGPNVPAAEVQHQERWLCHLHVDMNVPYGEDLDA